MTWEVKTICGCGEECVVKVVGDFSSQALAVPYEWTGFSNGYVIQEVFCPDCSRQLRNAGYTIQEEKRGKR